MSDSSSGYTFVDFFSGAGGFTEGLLLARSEESCFCLVAATDLHAVAAETHGNRFAGQLGCDYSFFTGDIREEVLVSALVEFVRDRVGRRGLDVVVGGPPCQGFSVFGKRDENDPRNDLFRPYLKAIQQLRPRYFVMENVPGLAKMYGGKAVECIHREVACMCPVRYGLVGPIKVNAVDFGVPQTRERILFIGHRKDMSPIKSITPTHAGAPITVRDAIGDLAFLRPWESNGHYRPSHRPRTQYQRDSRRGRLFGRLGITHETTTLAHHDSARHTPEVIARFAMIRPGAGLESIPRDLWASFLKTSKKWCVRLRADAPAYTVVTLPDDFIHYEQHRILTVREMARLQSFDDTFLFAGPRASGGGGKGNKKRNNELPQYSQVGNAVPPLMAEGIGREVLLALDAQSK
jgi:DNA (cytosine-5)-methyltransferase 1